jgi:glycosyltransferase involved in cell wall biosynthesis
MNIGILADSVFLPTGYSNIGKQMAKYLKKQGHSVHYFCVAYNGTDIDYARLPDGTEFDFKMYGEMQHSYFMNSIERYCKELKLDIVMIILDTFMLYPALLSKDFSPAKIVFFYPSDGGFGMPLGCDLILKKCDLAVAYSKFAQKQVKDYYGIDTLYIPIGTEPDRFYPLPEINRAELRIKYGLTNKFVVGVVARNQPRKFLDRTFKAFKLVKDKMPNAVLFMHTDPNDPAQAFNMSKMISDYNLENRVVFSGMTANKGFDWNKMNEVYNVMDCFLLTTSGEGWGIPLVEAMSCEIPVLATDYTTTPEIVKENNAGLGIKLSGVEEISSEEFFKDQKAYDLKVMNGTIMGSWMVERGIMDIEDCAEKLFSIYNNPDIAKQMGKNGRKAVIEKYNFNEHTAKPFEELFLRLCK